MSIISGPPRTRLTRGQLIFHGLLQAFAYLSLPIATVILIPKLSEIREAGGLFNNTPTDEPPEETGPPSSC